MPHHDSARPSWRKSSYSYQQGECVEVAGLDDATIGVRDSKNPDGPALHVTTAAFRGLLGNIRAGHLG